MQEGKIEFRRVLGEWLAERRTRLRRHPTAGELLALGRGELSNTGARRLREHLALCPECAAIFLDLARPEGIAELERLARLSDEQLEAAWFALRARLPP